MNRVSQPLREVPGIGNYGSYKSGLLMGPQSEENN